MRAIIDLITYLNWENVFVLFEDPNRIEDLIRFADNQSPKINFQFRIINTNSSNWPHLLKYVRSSGFSNLIIDLDKKSINKFLDIVIKLDSFKIYYELYNNYWYWFTIKAKTSGLTTSYYHFIFTTLDLSIISNEMSVNITGFQTYNSSDIEAFYLSLDKKRIKMGKSKIKNKPVRYYFCFVFKTI